MKTWFLGENNDKYVIMGLYSSLAYNLIKHVNNQNEFL